MLSHHPYGVADPQRHALHPDDAGVPDVGRLVRVLRAAERRKRVLPGGRTRRVWVTEISRDSSPPDPDGVPAARHARWLAEGPSELWRDGVSTGTWYRIRDQDPVPDYASQPVRPVSGLGGVPKRAARAYAFPFLATWTTGARSCGAKPPGPGSGAAPLRPELAARRLGSRRGQSGLRPAPEHDPAAIAAARAPG